MEVAIVLIVISIIVLIILRRSRPRKDNTQKSTKGESFLNIEGPDLNYLPDDLIEHNGEFYRITRSANNKFTLGYRCGAHNEKGAYFLSCQQKIMCSAPMTSPSDAKVSNNGSFIVMDCTGGLTSTFYAFNMNGIKIIEVAFRALPYDTGLSTAGAYAVVQMGNAPSETDGSKLIFFDLVNQREMWRVYPETGRADSYEFDDQKEELILINRDLGKFRYSYLDGDFLDLNKWEHRLISRGSGQDIMGVCRDRLQRYSGDISVGDVQDLQDILLRALEKQDIHSDDRAIAQNYRLSGEIYEAYGDLSRAISQYEKALDTDEGVGIKLKLKRLQKKLNT